MYRAPIEDIRFALEEIAVMDGLKTTGAFPELSSDLTAAILEEAGKFANDELAPLNRPGDLAGCKLEDGVVTTPPGIREAYAKFVEGGWQGLQFPAEHGGMGLPRALGAAVMETLQSANMAFSLGPMLTFGTIEALIAKGSDEQKAMYLPKLMTGEWSATMQLTEPQAGSDVGALRTKAEPNGDGSWSISGQKIYITWGEHDCAENIIHCVLARTPDGQPGTKGISLFLIPKILVNEAGSLGERNSIRAIGLEHKMGIHGSPTCVMEMTNAKGWLIGEEFGGMAAMFIMMNAARLAVGVQGVGIAERAYQQALAYAMDRKQGRAPGADGEPPHAIIHHPDVRNMLTTMKAKIEAARAVCYCCAVAADEAEYEEDEEDRAYAKRREELLTPISKAWSTDIGVEVSSLGIQVHGGMGFIEETGAAQHYRDARIAPIYEGTNGIQAIDLVGRKLSMAGGAPLAELLEDIRQTVEDCSTSSNPELPKLARRLGPAADALEAAAKWLIEPGRDRSDMLAGATAFQQLAGEVTGGWLLCVGAVSAQRFLKMGEGDPAFAHGKITLARHFAETVLSQAPTALSGIQCGAGLLADDTALGA
ncbi:acyl-CoA dehydrogenase [Hyphobacterium sp. HN65]|uniref:Acyl-CoA dehydrogenase n=1 Tax=Hyphobacterium lacteum TaxID=3116575 RepID=A0ABU7LNT1_9PROT|nr:acyl-CoA dehydrogenase [Hyphobacterium sp. HN65]MEE2525234.1 acyl-CoA dehydrogenase [Hyphobacterium sp. HN65]